MIEVKVLAQLHKKRIIVDIFCNYFILFGIRDG